MRARWEKILRDDFIKNKKWIVMNCTLEEYLNTGWNGGAFREEPTRERLLKNLHDTTDWMLVIPKWRSSISISIVQKDVKLRQASQRKSKTKILSV